MATNLTQQYDRARDTAFKRLLEAALDEVLPDVIGEAVGASVPAHPSGNVVLTAPMIAKRHALATQILGSSERKVHWVATFAMLAVGEATFKNIDPPALPTDAQFITTVRRLFNDCAGVLNGE